MANDINPRCVLVFTPSNELICSDKEKYFQLNISAGLRQFSLGTLEYLSEQVTAIKRL